jgi:hypothetical protein
VPFLIRERLSVDGVLVVDRTSPSDVYEVEAVEKTFRLDGREVTITFEFDGPLRPSPSKIGLDTPQCPWL